MKIYQIPKNNIRRTFHCIVNSSQTSRTKRAADSKSVKSKQHFYPFPEVSDASKLTYAEMLVLLSQDRSTNFIDIALKFTGLKVSLSKKYLIPTQGTSTAH